VDRYRTVDNNNLVSVNMERFDLKSEPERTSVKECYGGTSPTIEWRFMLSEGRELIFARRRPRQR
jgi:hypothetical protein